LNYKIVPVLLSLIVAVISFSTPAHKHAFDKPVAARFMVQGTYEESYQGRTHQGAAQGKLLIKFEAARWITMSTSEAGNAEFSDLPNAPAPYVSGSASYDGRVKGSSAGNSYDAMSSFAGPLGGNDVVLSVPEYTDSSNGFNLKVVINPKLKGKCSLVEMRGDETGTVYGCANNTYFFTASSPITFDDNDNPGKTPDGASFGIELDIEGATNPAETGQGAGDAGDYAWRGAVTTGSKEAGFKISLDKTKDVPTEDKRGRSIRKLSFSATIVQGTPKQ
jgi:hypothetical protein